jgi:hypothetical protein
VLLPPPPQLFTFDIFGTVVDWRRGMAEEAARRPHDRWGPSAIRVANLRALARVAESAAATGL